MDQQPIGQRLRQRREELRQTYQRRGGDGADWTQSHLAELLGVSTSAVSKMERGAQPVTVPMLGRWVEALGMHAEIMLIEGTPRPLTSRQADIVARVIEMMHTGSAAEAEAVMAYATAAVERPVAGDLVGAKVS